MSIGIYKIENLLNGKKYIGQSIHIETRWQEHCRASSNSLIGQAIKKYGKENFSFQILEEINNLDELNDKESFYIKKFNSLVPNGYNIIVIDSQEHHQFNKYSYDILISIINDIKNTAISFEDIAKKYDLNLSMIYYLNRGSYHNLLTEKYPLRQVQDMSKKEYFCVDCGCKISKGSTRCVKCAHLLQYKTTHPSRDELKILIRKLPFTTIAKQYNVSDNTIRKWCKQNKLPYKSSVIKTMTDIEWEKI